MASYEYKNLHRNEQGADSKVVSRFPFIKVIAGMERVSDQSNSRIWGDIFLDPWEPPRYLDSGSIRWLVLATCFHSSKRFCHCVAVKLCLMYF